LSVLNVNLTIISWLGLKRSYSLIYFFCTKKPWKHKKRGT